MLATTAVADGDDFVIIGRKWFITGAEVASDVIVMARMEDGSATILLSDMDRPGIRHVRQLDAMEACFTGGHGVLEFDGLRVPRSDVLGQVGKGFAHAQVRLAPARRTHCMRWLGQGAKGSYESSRTKVTSSEAQQRVVDRCVQILGGQGVTAETEVMRIFTDMRAFRIDDGPGEVHRWSMARRLAAGMEPKTPARVG